MKKMILLALALVLTLSFSLRAYADEGIYENAGDLYEAWVTRNQVPDYITAVISTDGGTDNLTFGVLEGEAGIAGQQEIYDLVRDDASVTIIYQTYSRNALYAIQEKLVDAYFGKDLGLVTGGVYEGINKIVFEIKSDYAENPDTLTMIDAVTAEYGNAVEFRFTDSVIQFTTTETIVNPPVLVVRNPVKPATPVFFAFALCAAMLLYMTWMQLRRRRIAALTPFGSIATEEQTVTTRELESAIRNTQPTPPRHLENRIMESIQKP